MGIERQQFNIERVVVAILIAIVFLPAFFIIYKLPLDTLKLKVILFWGIDCILILLPVFIESQKARELDWFSPMLYNIFFSVMGIFRPLFIVFEDWKTDWLFLSPEDCADLLCTTLLLSIVSRIVLLTSYYSPLGLRIAKKVRPIPCEWNKKRLYKFTFGLLMAGVISYCYIIYSNGGLFEYIQKIGMRRWMIEGKDYFLSLTLAGPIGLWLLIGQLWVKPGKFRIPFWALLLLSVYLIGISTLGGRGFILQTILISAGLFHYLKKKLNVSFLLLLGVIASFFLAIYEDVRVSTIQGSGEMNTKAVTQKRDFIETTFNRAHGTDRTMAVVNGVPDQVKYQYFTTYTRVITTIIPRSIWPKKPPLSEASVYAPVFGIKQNTIGIYPAGAIGDYYLQLGLLGIILGFILVGFWQRFLYEYLRLNSKNVGIVLMYMFALTSGVLTFRNLGIVAFLIKIIPLLLAINYIKIRNKRELLVYQKRISK